MVNKYNEKTKKIFKKKQVKGTKIFLKKKKKKSMFYNIIKKNILAYAK